jgi:spore coat polysaccharide biosynthesis protein SpsF
VDLVVVATSTDQDDDVTAAECESLGVPVVRGPLNDVLGRYVIAAEQFPGDYYVRLTADCPLLDPRLIDQCVTLLEYSPDLDFTSNAILPSFPRGFDVEVMSASALARVDAEAVGFHRVHVTSWITEHTARFRIAGIVGVWQAQDLRVTVDTDEDLKVVRAIVDALGGGIHEVGEVISWLRAHPEVITLNCEVMQKELTLG